MNVDEALLYLENLEVSFSDDEEIESDEDRDFVSRGELFILPPEDNGDGESDADSADEDEESPSTLSRKQLLAKASVSVKTLRSNVSHDWDSSDEITLSDVVNKQIRPNETSTSVSKKRHQAKSNQDPPRNWRSVDSTKRMQLNQWNQPSLKFGKNLQPQQIFELFLTDDEMQRICFESTNYARQKGNYVFTMTIEKFKSFLAILLLSGYNELPRQEMYRERQEDTPTLSLHLCLAKVNLKTVKSTFIFAITMPLILQTSLLKCSLYSLQ